jgi:hypothetical protein
MESIRHRHCHSGVEQKLEYTVSETFWNEPDSPVTSLWQADPAQPIGKARVGAKIVESGVSLEFIDMTTGGGCLLQSCERSTFFSEHGVILSSIVVIA